MIDVSIPLPPELKRWADRRVADGAYVDVGDYVRDLMRRDADHAADVARVQTLIDDGFASGIVDAEPEDILRGIIAKIPKQHG